MRDEECHPGGRGTLDLQALRQANCGSGEKMKKSKTKVQEARDSECRLSWVRETHRHKLLALAVLHFLATKRHAQCASCVVGGVILCVGSYCFSLQFTVVCAY